jgi:DNA-binding MarR family transcriptional regulator
MTGQRKDGLGPSLKPGAEADAEDVARRLRRSMMRLTRTLRQYDTDDLTPTLASALFTIAREGPLTLGELARSERMTNPSITAVVEKLTGQDLIHRRPDPDDRRVVRVTVTAAGRRRVDARRTQRTAWLTARLELLDPAELKRLSRAADILGRVAEDPEVRP